MRNYLFFVGSMLFCCLGSEGMADGPADNQAASVRPIPPPGISISEEDKKKIGTDLHQLELAIEQLQKSKEISTRDFLPDVEIFARAVSVALKEDGFFEQRDVLRAGDLINEGRKRADALKLFEQDKTFGLYWLTAHWASEVAGVIQPRMVVRGFRSKLDGTVQPYGIVSRIGRNEKNVRADIWCRGRSEKGLELQFLATRMNNPDPVPASGVLMIHPFGRYCNANKLAGEVDTLEALEHALQQYPIDPKRVAIRGFSMGGAAAWHLAVHYPDRWFAANPGAGFSETPLFLKVFQSEDLKPTWYEQKLWQMYDCPVWARNLRMLPTIAYSGEIDRQKQAADVMAEACWNLPEPERFELTHIVAPRTAHKVDPSARVEIEKRLDVIDQVRHESTPNSLTFTTTTLKYNQAHGVTIHALEEHWKTAVINTTTVSSDLMIKATNISDFSIEFRADQKKPNQAIIDGKTFRLPLRSDLSWSMRLRKHNGQWSLVSPLEPASKELVKKHNLQGPIDDAFMAPFLFVKPSGAGRHPEVDRWVDAEFQRAVKEWHRQMRGDVRVKPSSELKPDDIENYHLVLWGDPLSNPTITSIIEKLPIQWTAEQISLGKHRFSSKTHAPILIYPNPLNPERYVVLNSGFTYREYDYLNNARQIPKLPDWAIVDITTPPNSQWPGKIAEANFFGEKWELK